MNDEQIRSALDEWFRDTDPQPPNARHTAAHVMARVPQAHQRGRWQPFRRFRREARPPTATDTIAYQPSPVPASNGHTPTVIGRTSPMLSPVKAITAGAIVFAIGSAFLVAQPFDQQGTVPGAEAGAAAPTWITGTIQYAPSCSGPDSQVDGDVRHDWNYECSPQTWSASDPRFSGLVSSRWNEDVYRTETGFVAVNTTVDFLRNDEGGWTCSSSNLYEGFGLFPTHVTGKTATCVGQGGYEGLSAILVEDEAKPDHPFVGVIFAGGFPPQPEPPAAD